MCFDKYVLPDQISKTVCDLETIWRFSNNSEYWNIAYCVHLLLYFVLKNCKISLRYVNDSWILNKTVNSVVRIGLNVEITPYQLFFTVKHSFEQHKRVNQ